MDLVVCSVPKSNPESPLLGPCVISAAAKQLGFQSKVLDWNIELYQLLKAQGLSAEAWLELDSTFLDPALFLKFVERPEVKSLIDRWLLELRELQPRFVGFTAFSASNVQMVTYLAPLVRRILPSAKLILGGPGSYFCGPDLITTKTFDYVIIGYGESLIGGILKNEVKPDYHIVHQPVASHGTLPFCQPDYSDLDLGRYAHPLLHISASRGCVRHCQFCFVSSLWGSYQLRRPEDIAREMQFMFKQYNISQFNFTDSTFNGSLEHQRAVCEEISKLGIDFHWQAFVKVPPLQQSPAADYVQLSRAGCYLLKVGVESGSERVRREMGKAFSDEDLFALLENARTAHLKVDLFFMVGYPTETEQDFELTKALLVRLKSFQDVIENVRTAPTGLSEGTPIWKNRSRLEIQGTSAVDWHNPNSNPQLRYQRYQELRDHMFANGFNIRELEDKRMTRLLRDILVS